MKNDISATSLKDRIREFTSGMAKHAPQELLATIEVELTNLAQSAIAKGALQLWARAPDFSLPDARGGVLTLSSVLATGPAVVTFYRGGWCPFCDLQLRAYQEIFPELRELGAQLVAISPQTADYAQADVEEKQLRFPVLTDAHHIVARRYGLVFSVSDALRGLQTTFGNPLPKFNGDDSWELPMPGTFVVDRNAVVQLAHVEPDYRLRLEPAAILDAVRAANRERVSRQFVA